MRVRTSDLDATELGTHVSLVHAVRDLNLAAATARLSPTEMAGAVASVEALTAGLRGPESTSRLIRCAFEKPAQWARAGEPMPVNLLNPSQPEVMIHFDGDFAAAERTGDPTGLAASARIDSNALHEGPTDGLHGGIGAFLMDCMLGFLVQASGVPAVTGNLSVRYTARTPLETEIDLRSWIVSRSGRKIRAEGVIEHDGQVCVEASGLFVAIDLPAFRPQPAAG
jgi:acyl-coenzyme A thioesterase PaaI-like protein